VSLSPPFNSMCARLTCTGLKLHGFLSTGEYQLSAYLPTSIVSWSTVDPLLAKVAFLDRTSSRLYLTTQCRVAGVPSFRSWHQSLHTCPALILLWKLSLEKIMCRISSGTLAVEFKRFDEPALAITKYQWPDVVACSRTAGSRHFHVWWLHTPARLVEFEAPTFNNSSAAATRNTHPPKLRTAAKYLVCKVQYAHQSELREARGMKMAGPIGRLS
jgi:hypothetical protein